ncbi:DUF2732 family protein [Xenorhabdus szentirmaii]|uniref:Phage protein n=1 Tax=Xenorhabdus szentirmaii DSM 16338 TaxID=1427518 RepID=W1J1A5_9GAMM|nr:DUF2732 family protein [Xenorhabdus szentirmaii]PHM32055.1 hypothetical protein Xsze_02784 [Xenorhabdus szentirmaii DSM 16338]CDL83858.1 hypothetical protein XSR1_380022 [Xenorhabdus szentirmaii DSM 16338]
MTENYATKYLAKNPDTDGIAELIRTVRKEERQHCANLYSVRLVKLAARILNHEMAYSASSALLQEEIENIERQAQEWNYV